MTTITRRSFCIRAAAATIAGSALQGSAHATPFGLPLGLQLFSVRDLLPTDYEGTLRRLADLGYHEVEAAGFFGHSASQVRRAMDQAGLHCVSGHYSWNDLEPSLDKIVDFHQQLQAPYIICSFPGFKDPSRLTDHSFANQVLSFNLDDWRWNADQFNKVGAKIKQAGLKFGYHNHTMEFVRQQGISPFEELLRLTDPALVTIELDCGWVTVGGADPVDFLKRYPERISMLHIKDFKHSDKPMSVVHPPPAAELGRGTIDFHRIFAAADRRNIKHCFVEQEAYDMPPFDALQIDADFMKRFV
jgi:sugar phosphate isomerase/epimerase